MSLLQVEHLTVRFGSTTVVDDVSFTIAPGEKFALVGESGSGKTVSALSLMRLLPDADISGKILFEDQEILKKSDAALRQLRGKDIAMIFQEPMTALNPVHRVGRQIVENILLHQEIRANSALKRAVELMEWVGIPAPDERINDYPHQLSGGMRQRVMIAMALSCNPKILIADEPTTALDVTVQAQILDLIKRLQKDTGMAVILITHDLGVVAETCDDVAVMYAGRIVERGPVETVFRSSQHQWRSFRSGPAYPFETVFRSPQHPYTKGLMGCLPKLDHPPKTMLPIIPGMVPGLRDLPEGCRFAARCPNPHGDEVLAERQPWKECGSGHGVEACACFAKTL
jgi:oligopeptide/dipeptide ABC transporter ATP-binding protein